MGGAVSAGQTNGELIDNLVEADYIKDPTVEKVFRAVDRATYYHPDHRESAYKDLAWKNGNIHLSAPCIYAEVMESLKLEHGQSFLNLGSGTGYLNTLVGLVIGPYGVNHGIEYHADVIEYAKERLEEFKKNADSFDEFEFCEPTFVHGNCLLLNSGYGRYDRVYCGASCPQEHENYMKHLIKVGGILVMPLADHLLQIKREDETTWEKKSVLPVSFASLIVPNGERDAGGVELPELAVMSLQEICRVSVRHILHDNIRIEHPGIGKLRPRPLKVHKRTKRERRHRITVASMNLGMALLGNQADTESEEELGDLSEDSRDSDMLHDVRDNDDPSDYIIQQMLGMQRRFMFMPRREQLEQLHESPDQLHDDSDEGLGLLDEGLGLVARDTENGVCLEDENSSDHDMQPILDMFTERTSNTDDEVKEEEIKVEVSDQRKPSTLSLSSIEEHSDGFSATSNAIPISQGDADRCRYSSITSMSTSVTSGIGTCSSIEEPIDLDSVREIDPHPDQSHSNNPKSTNGSFSSSDKSSDLDQAVDMSRHLDQSVDEPSDVDQSRDDLMHQMRLLRSPPLVAIDYIATDEEHEDSDGIEDVDMARNEEEVKEEFVDTAITFRHLIREKVEVLPIPLALKQYLLFYRN